MRGLNLLRLIRFFRWECGIFLVLRRISSGSSAFQDAANCRERRDGLNLHLNQLLLDDLLATHEVIVIEIQPNQLYNLFDLIGGA
jgi:hypothetical protein